ncbi:phosphatidylinositol 3-kinase [Pichia membranifaciens]|uniref:Phosphatidylinositol 3-kinase VPS34 n=1 Tax=Pichia membranifaciens TaxID=4926 RepID=A0A1Q2YI50_9ASCO|nr:phosphatidylinositol 3-kinase [Pichia membranifaciens]
MSTTAGDKTSTVANFALSKDFPELVRFQIYALKGITTSLLLEKIYSDQNDGASPSLDCTSALIENKLKERLAETEIIAEVQIESGIGKKLTVPVIIGLSGKLEKQTCRPIIGSDNEITYIDDAFVKFAPSEGPIDVTPKTSLSSLSSATISASADSSSFSSMSSKPNILPFLDNQQWIELPIEYSKLPIEAALVFTVWCYSVRSGERLLLCTGRMPVFNDTCTLNAGRYTVELQLPELPTYSLPSVYEKKGTPTEDILEKIQFDNSRPTWLNKLTTSKLDLIESNKAFLPEDPKIRLIVVFPRFDIPIVFSDIKYVPISLPSYDPSNYALNYDPMFNEITYTNKINKITENNMSLIYSTESLPFDPDQVRGEQMEDPVEQKFRRLERMQHLSPLDKELKPTLRMRESLSLVMKKQFFEKMTAKERNMVWRYRWFMLNTLIVGNTPGWSNALINFIKCVDWNNSAEINEFEIILRNLKENLNLKTGELISWKKESAFDIFVKKLQIIDCLELLSSNYKNPIVRNMAVKRLEHAADSEISVFMVQLVQSIKNETLYNEDAQSENSNDKYDSAKALSINDIEVVHVDEEENELKTPGSARSGNTSNYTLASSDYQIVDTVNEGGNSDTHISDFIDNILSKNKKLKSINIPDIPSKFINFMINRVIRDASLTNYFYWCLKVEVEEEQLRNNNSTIYDMIANNNSSSKNNNATNTIATKSYMNNVNSSTSNYYPNNSTTTSQRIDGNANKFAVGSNKGILSVPATMNEPNKLFHKIVHELTMKKFIVSLAQSQHGKAKLYELRRQIELVNKLHSFCYKIKVDHRKETTPMKVEALKNMLTEKHKRTIFGSKYESRSIMMDENRSESMLEFPKLTIPLDPSVIVNGTIPEESAVFKSSLNPLKITFKTTQGSKYPIMYKIGDDLRQDQFVIQIITLMEKILESENMDLKLKPYKILATGEVEGFIQFIPNNSLSHILSKYNNSILLYLQTFNPDPTAHLGVNPQVMDNYVRSCAGYCVVTYILGVGDRHLENLLLSKDGHFFHADFGYILGQDPKPFPPLMKLPIQIIEGMGGADDINYKTFCQYCFITYITLRKNASLILNLVQLMINTSIPALRTGVENSEAEKMELLWKVEEKFMLDLNDEEAVLHFQNLIDSSVNAVLPVVIDRLHNLAQYWRS